MITVTNVSKNPAIAINGMCIFTFIDPVTKKTATFMDTQFNDPPSVGPNQHVRFQCGRPGVSVTKVQVTLHVKIPGEVGPPWHRFDYDLTNVDGIIGGDWPFAVTPDPKPNMGATTVGTVVKWRG